jgi:hypothetical protein
MDFTFPPPLSSTISSDLAEACATTKQRAREALNAMNGDVQDAVLYLLNNGLCEKDELRLFGGLSEAEAELYLTKAMGDLEAAKLLVLSGKRLPLYLVYF